MQYTTLGNSDLRVSRIPMSCAGFGGAAHGQYPWTIDKEQSRAVIRRGLELGVNFFDTAISCQRGSSEWYPGRVLGDFTQRDRAVAAANLGL